MARPAAAVPPHPSLRTLHTRHHVKLLCFWKHTTRREALKFFLEQVQGFIYEIPRGWERQKSGLRRLSAAPPPPSSRPPACIPATPACSYYRPSSGCLGRQRAGSEERDSGEPGDLALVPHSDLPTSSLPAPTSLPLPSPLFCRGLFRSLGTQLRRKERV